MTTTQEMLFDQEPHYKIVEDNDYKFIRMSVNGEWEDCCEVGSITLLNVISGLEEEFTIWCGNGEGNYFYVCLPTVEYDENDEEELYVTSIESFGTDISSFMELSREARLKATNTFIDGLQTCSSIPVSFREAYRTLRHANKLYLYDTNGDLLSNDGMY